MSFHKNENGTEKVEANRNNRKSYETRAEMLWFLLCEKGD